MGCYALVRLGLLVPGLGRSAPRVGARGNFGSWGELANRRGRSRTQPSSLACWPPERRALIIARNHCLAMRCAVGTSPALVAALLMHAKAENLGWATTTMLSEKRFFGAPSFCTCTAIRSLATQQKASSPAGCQRTVTTTPPCSSTTSSRRWWRRASLRRSHYRTAGSITRAGRRFRRPDMAGDPFLGVSESTLTRESETHGDR